MPDLQNKALQAAPYPREQEKKRADSHFRRIPLWIYTLILILAVWEIYARYAANTFLPSVSRVVVTMIEIVLDGSLFSALFTSMQALLIGFALSVVVGLTLGLAMGCKKWADRAFSLYLDVLTAIPMVAIIPLVVVFFGLDLAARVVVVFLFAFVIIVVNTKVGIQASEAQLIEMAYSFGASRMQIVFKVLIPSALPSIVAGLRLALGRAIVGMVTAEMILSTVGIGDFLMKATTSFNSSKVMAIVISLLIVSALLITACTALENRLLKHKR